MTMCAPRAIGWDPAHTATEHARRTAEWHSWTQPCGHCWGQRRVLEPAGNGEGLVPVTCPVCAGAGRVATKGPR